MFYLIQSRSFISTHFIHLYQVSTMSILTSMQQEKEQFVCVPSSEKSPSRTSGHPSQQLTQEYRGATGTFGRGGALYHFVRVWWGGGEGGFPPPFSKIFKKQKCLFKGLKSKKRKFWVVADLAVFNSNRFFSSVF